MKLKRSYLEMMMKYVQKEKPEVVDVVKSEEFTAGVVFNFKDSEGRDCSISLYEAQFNCAPDLTKKMKLYSRFPAKASPSSEQDPASDT